LDWLALALFSAAVVRTGAVVAAAVRTGRIVTCVEASNRPPDPLLCGLLALALLPYRSVEWVSAVPLELRRCGLSRLPAAACFALAPAYQLEAIGYARDGRRV
jgi:hypothetical protein